METLHGFASMMNNKIEQPLRSHLKNVYASIAASSVSAAAGSYLHVSGIWEGGLLSTIGSFALLMMLMTSRGTQGKENGTRFMYLMGFALCTGLSSGNLIESVWDIDPSIVISALLYTCVIFTCFSLSALIAPEGKYLAIGGPLLSLCSAMLLASLLNLIFRSHAFAYMQLLIGLAMMSAFILYDTQLIMEKFRMGDRDYIAHTLSLFIDLVSVFKHILVLLADKEQGNRKKKSNR